MLFIDLQEAFYRVVRPLAISGSWSDETIATMEWKKGKTHWHEAVNSALNFPFLKEVSQNFVVFDVVNLEN